MVRIITFATILFVAVTSAFPIAQGGSQGGNNGNNGNSGGNNNGGSSTTTSAPQDQNTCTSQSTNVLSNLSTAIDKLNSAQSTASGDSTNLALIKQALSDVEQAETQANTVKTNVGNSQATPNDTLSNLVNEINAAIDVLNQCVQNDPDTAIKDACQTALSALQSALTPAQQVENACVASQ